MTLISATNLTMRYGLQLCFQEVNCTLAEGARVGLIGANGTGKTTLLRIITGDVPTNDIEGLMNRRKGLRIAAMEQDPQFTPGQTVYQAVLAATRLAELEAKMSKVHDQLAEPNLTTEKMELLLKDLEDLEHQLESEGGFELESKARIVLSGVGLEEARHEQKVETLSGGERNRVALARLLIQEPDLWLLDEPTNHLDLAGIEFLEKFFNETNTAVIFISHDRRFLDAVTTETWEIENKRLYCYPAPYTRAKDLRAERIKAAKTAYEKQQDFIERQSGFVRRYKAGQRAKEARGRLTRLNRLERLEQPEQRAALMMLNLPECPRMGTQVLKIDEVSKSLGGRTLFENISLEVEPGETLGIIGPNGAGKSTLLRIITGLMKPDKGEATWGASIKRGMLQQEENFTNDQVTPFLFMRSCQPKANDKQLRDTLGAMLFGGESADKPVSVLSGGERKRLMMTKLLMEGNNVLILDEPTNHLDLPSREAVELALLAFEGSVIVVSHDRYLLDLIADRILWIENGSWKATAGGYAEAKRLRAEAKKEAQAKAKQSNARSKAVDAKPAPLPVAVSAAPAAGRASGGGGGRAVVSGPVSAKLQAKIARMKTEELEAQILERQESLEKMQAQFGDPGLYSNLDKVQDLHRDMDDIQRELNALENEYQKRVK
ncbi:MAG TPA: ABC-F family ATP-binding cassette domain-containing protein [Planctomycetota bacterium]|nr:ABC-F family ATP-binding cassette domain-containing protein [Planctomycetota bacterium]